MPERPRVSIILPTFNSHAYLAEAVRSVLSQTYQDWELLVADDGSTDGTRAYVEGLAHPGISFITCTHSGNPGRVRNQALTRARGHYVAFLDSDDWWAPEKLAAQHEILARHPECRWCYTGLHGVGADGREVELFDARGFVPHDGWILEQLAAGAAVTTSTVMAERALVEAAGGFDERFAVAEDLDLWLRLAQVSPVAVVSRVLVTRRVHAGSYSAPYRDRFVELNDAFRMMIAKAPSGRVRRQLLGRRRTWLVRLAGRHRQSGEYGAAWATLAAALPQAVTSLQWWAAVLRTVWQRSRH